ncbi:hypothetical protein D3C76_1310810 [compost metagenome]
MSSREIKDDDALKIAESRLFEIAAELDDPLADKSSYDYRKKKRIYDITAAAVEKYRKGRMVQKYPGLREKYKILGWEFQEFNEPAEESVSPAEESTPQELPASEPEPPKLKPSVSAWLDD